MSRNYEYYHSRNSEPFSFYRIPKALFTDASFCELSTDAKLLYPRMPQIAERKENYNQQQRHIPNTIGKGIMGIVPFGEYGRYDQCIE